MSAKLAVAATPARIDAHPLFTGKGVTVAFLDSGFTRHPDLSRPKDRILACVDANTGAAIESSGAPDPWDWHGTQTSVAAAGNGFLSAGTYRGAAPDAKVVLVRIGSRGRISDEHISRGIEWVIRNKERYRIDVLNISAGGDEPISYTSSVADQAAEEAVRRRVVVVVAAGNSGFEANHQPMPPANSPSVITVGGYDDKNGLRHGEIELYRSSFGPTVDGLVKPEIVAPAAWVAAPILENTPSAARAAALVAILEAADADLAAAVRKHARASGLGPALAADAPAAVRAAVERALESHKIVAPHYQHVDGTSFAAPVVASVVAQMIEANPDLSPAAVKHILLATAGRLGDGDLYRQGFGMLNARRAVEEARRAPGGMPDAYFRGPHHAGGEMVFYYLDAAARQVGLAGDFNDWSPEATPFRREPNGLWRAAITRPEPGVVRYKFVVDGERWIEDPNNWLKLEDPVGGFHSVTFS